MKKLKLFFALMVVVSLLANSCSTTKAYDKSIPVEETCEIEIMNSIYLKTFDGRDVSGKFKTPNLGTLKLIIPAGNHGLTFDIFYSDTINVIKAYGLVINYNFIAGHKYIVRSDPPFILLRSGDKVRIDIVDLTQGVTDGLLTINGLEEFNGKYISFSGQVGKYSFLMGSKGKKGISNDIGVQIENGRAEIPVYYWDTTATMGVAYGPFSGDASASNINIYIGDEELFNRKSIKKSRQFTINEMLFIDAKAIVNLSDLTSK